MSDEQVVAPNTGVYFGYCWIYDLFLNDALDRCAV